MSEEKQVDQTAKVEETAANTVTEPEKKPAKPNKGRGRKQIDPAEKLKQEQEAFERIKLLRNVAIVVAILCVVAILVYVVYENFVVPNTENGMKYIHAEEVLESGDYEKAAELFAALGDYRDASERVDEANEARFEDKYQMAVAYLEDNDLISAVPLLNEMGDYKDAADLLFNACQSVYDDAEKALANGEFEAAAAAFASLGEYKDAEDRADEVLRSVEYCLQNINSSDIGKIVSYGPYRWTILQKEDGRALLLAYEVMDVVPYNETNEENMTWEACSLRSYLNTEVLSTFTEDEIAHIADTELDNSGTSVDNPFGPNTVDKLFCLNVQEVKTLITPIMSRTEGTWWLRSPGNIAYLVATMDRFMGSSSGIPGYTTETSHPLNEPNVCARPAMWVIL